jgi:uncharacterized protein (TIGR00106 family)
MTVIAEVTTYPIGKGISLSPYVKMAIRVLDESGLSYKIGPMSTTIEAETVVELLNIIGKMHNAIGMEGCERISTAIRIDDRRDKKRTMMDKVDAVRPSD